MSLLISGDLRLRRTWQPMDPDAAAYIAAVEAADTQSLEQGTKIAIDNFVLGCKADGIWSAIKASCILAGARTRLGALTPLVGTAPTSFNFVNGDYNRKTGLVGDGSTKYLDSNRSNNVDPQNNRHLSVYTTTGIPAGERAYIGALPATGFSFLYVNAGAIRSSLSATAEFIPALPIAGTGLVGVSRSLSSSYIQRNGSVSQLANVSSNTPGDLSLHVFRFNRVSNNAYTNARLAFYSIGESLDLALLDARVTALINAFAAAIP